MLVYMLLMLAYNYWLLSKQNIFTFWTWVKPLFLLSGLLSVYFVLPGGFWSGLFLIFSIAVIYFVETNILLVSEQVNFLITLLSYFGISMALAAANFYFLQRGALALALLGAATFLIARSSFDYVPQPDQRKNFFSVFLALSLVELAWALGFLPFHYSIFSLVLLNVFYCLWILVYYHLFNNLSAKKVSFHILLSGIIIIIAFISTPWK